MEPFSPYVSTQIWQKKLAWMNERSYNHTVRWTDIDAGRNNNRSLNYSTVLFHILCTFGRFSP